MNKSKSQLRPEAPKGVRFRPRDKELVVRYQEKYGFASFTEALRQMIRKAAELEGWL